MPAKRNFIAAALAVLGIAVATIGPAAANPTHVYSFSWGRAANAALAADGVTGFVGGFVSDTVAGNGPVVAPPNPSTSSTNLLCAGMFAFVDGRFVSVNGCGPVQFTADPLMDEVTITGKVGEIDVDLTFTATELPRYTFGENIGSGGQPGSTMLLQTNLGASLTRNASATGSLTSPILSVENATSFFAQLNQTLGGGSIFTVTP